LIYSNLHFLTKNDIKQKPPLNLFKDGFLGIVGVAGLATLILGWRVPVELKPSATRFVFFILPLMQPLFTMLQNKKASFVSNEQGFNYIGRGGRISCADPDKGGVSV